MSAGGDTHLRRVAGPNELVPQLGHGRATLGPRPQSCHICAGTTRWPGSFSLGLPPSPAARSCTLSRAQERAGAMAPRPCPPPLHPCRLMGEESFSPAWGFLPTDISVPLTPCADVGNQGEAQEGRGQSQESLPCGPALWGPFLELPDTGRGWRQTPPGTS